VYNSSVICLCSMYVSLVCVFVSASPGSPFVFSVVAGRLAGKSVSEMTYLVLCQPFGTTSSGATGSSGGQVSQAFTKTGFTNWKKALEKNAGFVQHADSR